jgi:site-specific DNA-cytosine methylase
MHAACPWLDVVAAVDINRDSQSVYALNFQSPYWIRELETLSYDWLASQGADLWWMSPPCTPFSRRGHRKGLADPRARSLVQLIHAVPHVQPEMVVLENVVGFEDSSAFDLLSETWSAVGYRIQHRTICPTHFGWPNRRPRVYVLASRSNGPSLSESLGSTPNSRSKATYQPRLQQLLCDNWNSQEFNQLVLDPTIANGYAAALDIVDPTQPDAVAACFGSSYGRVVTKAGSYIRFDQGLRRFAPREIANVLGFPETFRFPEHLTMQRLWHLLGNSLSLPVVSSLLEFTRS